MPSTLKIVAACAVTAVAVGATGATAASLITGSQVKNNSLTGLDVRDLRSGDIRDRAIRLRDLSPEVVKAIQGAGANTGASVGTTGANGAPGATGPGGTNGSAGANGNPGSNGTNGANGANGSNANISSGNWGVIARNTIGSPDIFMRSGPGTAPRGTGSLGFSVSSGPPIEKAAFGNEQDFAGTAVADLNAVGFSVYTTGENAALGSPNMPSIAFEVDPNLTATPSNFSTLVFVPNNTTPNQWTAIDATDAAAGSWFLTGAAGTATSCNQTTTCTFAQVKTALAQGTGATILTAGVTKGRDLAWQGAIDALRINNQVFDFEETGVTAGTP
ncbi:MAG TPA: hypothetical protein VL120_16635 [Solirubrobacteraceae bacterium]|nr:hypothetical protein [Solirubrobacteraceae bacterium]